jgi:hypothetical protein
LILLDASMPSMPGIFQSMTTRSYGRSPMEDQVRAVFFHNGKSAHAVFGRKYLAAKPLECLPEHLQVIGVVVYQQDLGFRRRLFNCQARISHSDASRNPEKNAWMPAFTGMTGNRRI